MRRFLPAFLGEFGSVVEGRLSQQDGTLEKVAVKTMKSEFDTRERKFWNTVRAARQVKFPLCLQWTASPRGRLRSSWTRQPVWRTSIMPTSSDCSVRLMNYHQSPPSPLHILSHSCIRPGALCQVCAWRQTQDASPGPWSFCRSWSTETCTVSCYVHVWERILWWEKKKKKKD